LLGFLFAPLAFAGSGEVNPVVLPGVNFHSGTTGQSMTGAMGYMVTFMAEARRNHLRPDAGLELEYISGKTDLGTNADVPVTINHAAFLAGAKLFIFKNGTFQPYLGANGLVAYDLMKIQAPPTGVEGNTTSLGYGYELAAGVDFRRRDDGQALRLQAGVVSLSTTLAGVSGFQLSGFRIALGLVL
jgi:hypothetical protein